MPGPVLGRSGLGWFGAGMDVGSRLAILVPLPADAWPTGGASVAGPVWAGGAAELHALISATAPSAPRPPEMRRKARRVGPRPLLSRTTSAESLSVEVRTAPSPHYSNLCPSQAPSRRN